MAKIDKDTDSVEGAVDGFFKAFEGFSPMTLGSFGKMPPVDFGKFSSFGRDNIEAMMASFGVASEGLQQIRTELSDYVKQSVDAGVEHAKSMRSAKSFGDLVEMQSAFASEALDDYVGQMSRLSDLYVETYKNALEPLTERVKSASKGIGGLDDAEA